jgi:hypothetical protein
MSTSQNGWPALAADSKLLHHWLMPDGTVIYLRNGSAGFNLIHCALWFDHDIEDLKEPVLDDWGYAFRPIRGYSSDLSNHASGTADDLNATDHPLGVDHTFSPKEIDAIHKRLKLYEGVIRWGGDYSGRKDSMHFEINKPMRECERVARKLLDTPRGKRILELNPGQKAVILS